MRSQAPRNCHPFAPSVSLEAMSPRFNLFMAPARQHVAYLQHGDPCSSTVQVHVGQCNNTKGQEQKEQTRRV